MSDPVGVKRERGGKIAYKLPGKGSRWRGGFADMSEAMQDAMKEHEPPFDIDFVDEAEESAAEAPKKRRKAA